MSNTFSGLNMASAALRNFERALDTTGHNVSNVNTPGYSRQTVQFSQLPGEPFYSYGHLETLGGGVTITNLSRIRDQFLGQRQQATQSEQSRLDTLNGSLNEVQSVFQDATGGGISDAISGFFNAWSNLSADPSQAANRVKVQQAGQTVADDIRGTYLQLQDLKSQQTQLANQTIQQIQTLANQVATLNKQIQQASATGGQPNDLLDQRDQAVLALSKLTNISPNVFSDGSMNISVGGFDLVDSQGANAFPTSFDPTTMTVSDGTFNYPITGGQLAGTMQSLNSISGYMTSLDNLANNLRTEVNTLHQTGTNPEGGTNVDFFNDASPQTGAINFDLSAAVKGDPNQIVTSINGTAGDGGIALAIANLQSSKVAALGNSTFSDYYNGVATQIGSDVNTTQSSLDTQNSVAQQISNQIQAVSGVSLDDEMTNMLQFQRSYQAAAKVLSIFDQVTQDVIGLIK